MASDALCRKCSSINFDEMSSADPQPNKNIIVWVLGLPTESWKLSSCPLCRFFYLAAPSKPEGLYLDDDNLYLEAFRFVDEASDESIFLRLRWRTGPIQMQLISATVDSPRSLPLAPVGRLISSKVGDLVFVKSWIDRCMDNHGATCNKPHPFEFESITLIDCRTRRLAKLTTKENYLALSYVWGFQKAQSTTSYRDQVPEMLPRTVEDAIVATVTLGFHYLWVDRYCIPNDDLEEMQNQIQNMDMIYRQATATLIATAGNDASYGLSGMGYSPRKQQPSITIGGRTLVTLGLAPMLRMNESVWNTRGWTYQEGVLSRRRIYFTEQQMYFECHTSSYCETLVDGPWSNRLYNLWYLSDVVSPSLRDSPSTHIARYTKRQLTYEHDTLNAISGVLNAWKKEPAASCNHSDCAQTTSRHHYGGLAFFGGCSHRDPLVVEPKWSLSVLFLIALCWELREPADRRACFPSWSWIGWAGIFEDHPLATSYHSSPTRFDPLNPESMQVWIELGNERIVTLEEFQTSLHPNVFDPLPSTYITIKATITKLRFVKLGVRGFFAPLGNRDQYFWELRPTRKIEQGSAWAKKLTKDTFLGIVIAQQPERSNRLSILVVNESEEGGERIGLIATENRCVWEGDGILEDGKGKLISFTEDCLTFDEIKDVCEVKVIRLT